MEDGIRITAQVSFGISVPLRSTQIPKHQEDTGCGFGWESRIGWDIWIAALCVWNKGLPKTNI